MQTAASAPGAQKPAGTGHWGEWANGVSKYWIPTVALVYAAGYVVQSLYRSSFGLDESSFLRPQIAGAGLAFLGTAAIALFTASWTFSTLSSLPSGWSEWKVWRFRLSFGVLFLFLNDCFAAAVLQSLFVFKGTQNWPVAFPVTGMALWIIITTLLASQSRISPAAVLGSPPALVVCVAAYFFLFAASIPWNGQFGIRQFALYLLIAQGTIPVVRRGVGEVPIVNCVVVTGELIILLLGFALFVYPQVRPAFGGGHPARVTMIVNELNGPSDALQRLTGADLVDETDAGYYVLPAGQSRVSFIPRRSVFRVEFERP